MNSYHAYLLKTSRLGTFYRKYFLFPWLSSKLGCYPALDVGTGLGDLLDFLPLGSQGIDINQENVNYAKSLGRDVVLTSSVFPFSESTWRQVVSDQVLEHLMDPVSFLSEVRRVLIPGGIFIVGIPCYSGYLRDPDHKRFYDLNSLKILMHDNGFAFKSHHFFPFPFSFFGRFMRQQSLYAIFVSLN